MKSEIQIWLEEHGFYLERYWLFKNDKINYSITWEQAHYCDEDIIKKSVIEAERNASK